MSEKIVITLSPTVGMYGTDTDGLTWSTFQLIGAAPVICVGCGRKTRVGWMGTIGEYRCVFCVTVRQPEREAER